MHPNRKFRHPDPALRDRIIRDHPFATVFLQTPDGPRAAQTPVERVGPNRLHFHLARANTLSAHLDGARALVVITGPHAYISARWYEEADQISTWNYVTYEIEGPVARYEGKRLRAFLERLADHHEGRIRTGDPWRIKDVDKTKIDHLLTAIVGFDLTMETTRETVKLSQNKPANERARLIEGLEDEGAHAITALMQQVGA